MCDWRRRCSIGIPVFHWQPWYAIGTHSVQLATTAFSRHSQGAIGISSVPTVCNWYPQCSIGTHSVQLVPPVCIWHPQCAIGIASVQLAPTVFRSRLRCAIGVRGNPLPMPVVCSAGQAPCEAGFEGRRRSRDDDWPGYRLERGSAEDT